MMKIFISILISVFPFLSYGVINVVTTLSDYAVIAKNIGVENVVVNSIVHPDEDPHHVRPKPSYALLLKEADLFVTTGLDLELWVPSLLNRAGNPKIRSGQIGFVSAASGIPLIDKPTNLSHSEGGLHVYGNPHVTTSPLNMLYIANNITTGLIKVDPLKRNFYEKNYNQYRKQLIEDLFGKEIPAILGESLTVKMAEQGKLYSFLEKKKMLRSLGGWFKKALRLRDRKIVSYHKNWGYLVKILNLNNVECIEVKPGVPPTPEHVITVIDKMKTEAVKTIVGANYFSISKMNNVASKVNAKLAVLRMGIDPSSGSILTKFNTWVDEITKTL